MLMKIKSIIYSLLNKVSALTEFIPDMLWLVMAFINMFLATLFFILGDIFFSLVSFVSFVSCIWCYSANRSKNAR